MYLGSWAIDDYLPIPAVTHRFSSGAAYTPTSLTYTIYQSGSTAHLVENVDMTPASPFDSVTGLYYARQQLTAVAGFTAGTDYVVVIKATVDGVSAIEAHTFQILATTVAASVTAAVTAGTVSDKTGYALSAAGVDAILDEAITEPAAMFAWATATLRNIMGILGAFARNKQTLNKTTGAGALRNDADDANISTRTDSDDGTTYTRGEAS